MPSKSLQSGLEKNESEKEELRDPEYESDVPRIMNSLDKKGISRLEKNSDDLNFTIKLFKNWRIRIYKPLITLKLVLFFWYGGGSFIIQFLTIYFKQRGLTLSEISIAFILAPTCQFLGTTLSGVAADKIGRSRPVLVVNLVLVIVFLAGILFIPRLNNPSCLSQPVSLECNAQQFDRLIAMTSCDMVENIIEVNTCDVQCPENVTDHCDGQNFICRLFAKNEINKNFSLIIHVNGDYKMKGRCYYNVSSLYHENTTESWCDILHKRNCKVSCIAASGVNCLDDSNNRNLVLITVVIFFIVFQTAYSTCYRIMDVTSMALVKQHSSDFGHERFFCSLGTLVVSPMAGYLVDATTQNELEENNLAALYFFIFIVLIILRIVFKLEVTVNPPGKKMRRKAACLLKNPDVSVFILVVFVLGSTYSFSNLYNFWYLDEMNTSGMLKGLIPAAAALYGMPFLLTSKWWVKKIGTPQMFILGLLGHVINTFGYSFLKDPWYALILEASNILTYDLLWVAVVLHSRELAPEGLIATVISTAGSIHYQIGKASGGAIGGFVMDAFGGLVAFRVMGTICLISAVLYAFYLSIRRTCFSRGSPAGTVIDGHPKDDTISSTNR